MPKPISEYADPAALRILMANAKRQKRDDVWREAFRRLCELEGMGQTSPMDRDFYRMLAAYEGLLSEKNGRLTRATRTRQKLKNKGVIRCLEEWARSPKATQGFDMLVANGLVELTAEYMVLTHRENFSAEAVFGAGAKLARHGIAAPKPMKAD
jgi:hypothetical protein